MNCIDSMMSFSAAVHHRRDRAATKLETAWRAGKRICVLGCGRLREADWLVGEDLSKVVGVDLDLGALEQVWRRHGHAIELIEDDALTFLCSTAQSGRQFDYIYTLGLADHCGDDAMLLLHKLMKSCLADGGEMMVANVLPDPDSRGWMDQVMDWKLVYRTEADMERFARSIGMTAQTSRDPTGCIVFSEMSAEVSC